MDSFIDIPSASEAITTLMTSSLRDTQVRSFCLEVLNRVQVRASECAVLHCSCLFEHIRTSTATIICFIFVLLNKYCLRMIADRLGPARVAATCSTNKRATENVSAARFGGISRYRYFPVYTAVLANRTAHPFVVLGREAVKAARQIVRRAGNINPQ